jgi:hypothetical protein
MRKSITRSVALVAALLSSVESASAQSIFADLDLQAARALAQIEERHLLVALVDAEAREDPAFELLFEHPDVVAWIRQHALAIRVDDEETLRLGLDDDRSYVHWRPSLSVETRAGRPFTRVEGWEAGAVVTWLERCDDGSALDDMRAIFTAEEYQSQTELAVADAFLQSGQFDEGVARLEALWEQTRVRDPFPASSGTDLDGARSLLRVWLELRLPPLTASHADVYDLWFEQLALCEQELRRGSGDPYIWSDWMSLAMGLGERDRIGDVLVARDEPMALDAWTYRGGRRFHPGPPSYKRDDLYRWAVADPSREDVLRKLPDLEEFVEERCDVLERHAAPDEEGVPDSDEDAGFMQRLGVLVTDVAYDREARQRESDLADARAIGQVWAGCRLHGWSGAESAVAQAIVRHELPGDLVEVILAETAVHLGAPLELPDADGSDGDR